MTSMRSARPRDLFRMGKCNLDPLVENYDVSFYNHYLATWPKLFIVIEDKNGDIIAYGSGWLTEPFTTVMGKLEEDPPHHRFSPNYLPWHGHVTALTVAPQWRRMGLAKKLTLAFEKACEEQDAWFVDLFVRKSNPAVEMYKGMGYSVYRRVRDYYSDDPIGGGPAEDAFDMRKPLERDTKNEHIRADGEKFAIDPEDLYNG